MHFSLDTSALVKLFHEEIGSALVQAIMDEPAKKASISHLAIVEFGSVVALKVRTGALTPAEADLLLNQLFASVEAGDFVVESIIAEDFDQALQLINLHGRQRSLKTLDALHLATALRQKRQGRLDYFVTGDRALSNVGKLAGLAVIGPE